MASNKIIKNYPDSIKVAFIKGDSCSQIQATTSRNKSTEAPLGLHRHELLIKNAVTHDCFRLRTVTIHSQTAKKMTKILHF